MEIEPKKKRGRPATSDSREVEARANRPVSVKVASSGSPYLDKVREQIVKAYTPEYVQKRVGDLMEACDEKQGKDGMIVRTPNWKAREGGLKTLLQITGIEKAEENQKTSQAPTKIVINVLQSPNSKEAVKVKAKEVVDIPNEAA